MSKGSFGSATKIFFIITGHLRRQILKVVFKICQINLTFNRNWYSKCIDGIFMSNYLRGLVNKAASPCHLNHEIINGDSGCVKT